MRISRGRLFPGVENSKCKGPEVSYSIYLEKHHFKVCKRHHSGVRAEGYSVKPLPYRMKTEARAGEADSPDQTVANRIIFSGQLTPVFTL